MIVKPVLIVGAPRSGTSMLQKILRGHPAAWSLPSESDIIWERYCHPRLRDWKSQTLSEADIDEEMCRALLRQFGRYAAPASVWKPVERTGMIWGFQRRRLIRRALRAAFAAVYPLVGAMLWARRPQRLIEKTVSNCFRLGFVNEVFPDAKILYPTRDGRNSINSLLQGWLHPTRFFTYDVPEPLSIEGYPHEGWKFVLPDGWRDYTNRPLEEVCAFQWLAFHEAMLAEISKPKFSGRVLRFRLEDLTEEPEEWLRRITEFAELPYDDYFRGVARDLPVVNSPDGNVSREKWRQENPERIQKILPTIAAMQRTLGYED